MKDKVYFISVIITAAFGSGMFLMAIVKCFMLGGEEQSAIYAIGACVLYLMGFIILVVKSYKDSSRSKR